MKQDSKLIRVDLDFKNAFNSAGHSSLRKILEGFGIPDVSLLSSIYERSTMRILVGNERSAAIQLDTGTVQGSALSSFLFDLFINALLRLLDSTGILHRVRGVPEWNLQAFADDLSLYVSSTEDANTLLNLVGSFQEWSGLKISIKKSLVTGALYGQGEIRRQRDAMAVIRKRKPPPEAQRLSRSKLQETQELEQMDPDFEEDLTPVDEEINEACEELRSRSLLQRCDTCGRHRDKHHFPSSATNQCTQCSKSWTPRGIAYQGETLKVIRGRTPTRLLGTHHNMWLDTKSQRRKVIDAAIEVAAYLYKNENLRIDQRLKVISMCLPSLFSFSAPLIDLPEADLKTLTAVWVRAYKNAWNSAKGTATCLFTYPREQGGLQVKLPLGTLFSSIWGNLERYSQFDDGTRQMLELTYHEALADNGCLNLLELQDAAQHLGWKRASTNEVTFACYLASKLEIRVEWDPFNPDLIVSAPHMTLATLAC